MWAARRRRGRGDPPPALTRPMRHRLLRAGATAARGPPRSPTTPVFLARRDPVRKEIPMSATLTKPEGQTAQHAGTPAVRPFRFEAPQAALDDLRRRIAATNWPERETVADASQGVPLATMQELARYWATDYDWRKVEAK